MNKSLIFHLGTASLVCGAVTTVVVMLRAAAWSVDAGTLLFIAWAVSPFACFYFAGSLFRKISALRHTPFIFLVVSDLMLAFTLFAYLSTLEEISSTYALIFVVVPLYLYIGGFALLGIASLVSWLVTRRSRATL